MHAYSGLTSTSLARGTQQRRHHFRGILQYQGANLRQGSVVAGQKKCQRCFIKRQAQGEGARSKRSRSGVCFAFEHNSGSHKDPVDEYVDVKVENVKPLQGTNVVYLRIGDSDGGGVVHVHIGEAESNALLQELKKAQKPTRPLTHDAMRNMLQAVGVRVTKVRITEIVANTYYARIFLLKPSSNDVHDEVDIDARPSDAINLAVRFNAPIQVNKRIAAIAKTQAADPGPQSSESNAEIVKSVKETLSSFEDPTVMFAVQKEVAIKEQRFEDALDLQQRINHEMTHNPLLRLVVAMEAAVADGRYDEAARLRDEFRKAAKNRSVTERA